VRKRLVLFALRLRLLGCLVTAELGDGDDLGDNLYWGALC
jgi:hypothetical protein